MTTEQRFYFTVAVSGGASWQPKIAYGKPHRSAAAAERERKRVARGLKGMKTASNYPLAAEIVRHANADFPTHGTVYTGERGL